MSGCTNAVSTDASTAPLVREEHIWTYDDVGDTETLAVLVIEIDGDGDGVLVTVTEAVGVTAVEIECELVGVSVTDRDVEGDIDSEGDRVAISDGDVVELRVDEEVGLALLVEVMLTEIEGEGEDE